jgi:hypothetical protein
MHFDINFSKLLTPRNAIVSGIVLALVIAMYFINWSYTDTVVATVQEVESAREYHRKKTSSGRQTSTLKYRKLIHTDKGTFEDKSDYLRGKIGSTYYMNVFEGGTYEFTLSGLSIPLFRNYPNIVGIKQITEGTAQQVENLKQRNAPISNQKTP